MMTSSLVQDPKFGQMQAQVHDITRIKAVRDIEHRFWSDGEFVASYEYEIAAHRQALDLRNL